MCFSQSLLTCKDNLPILQLSYKCNMSEASLRRILYANTNYFVESAVNIVSQLGYLIAVSHDEMRFIIDSTESLTAWAKKSMTDAGFSLNKFKDLLGITRVALTANYNGTSKMRIDTFLKWAELTGYTVDIQSK